MVIIVVTIVALIVFAIIGRISNKPPKVDRQAVLDHYRKRVQAIRDEKAKKNG